MHTRGAPRQDPEAKESTPERRKLQITSTGKEEPRTGQLAREQRSLESRKAHIDETPREETVEQPRGQREAGRRAAGKVAEAPTEKDDDP